MSFRWKQDESVRQGARRLVRRQIDRAVDGLRENGPEQDQAIHSVRKGLKQVRALLRLIRPSLGKKVYRRENSDYRDSARPLTEVRDAKIAIDSLDDLIRHAGNQVVPGDFDELRELLKQRHDAIRNHLLNETDVVDHAVEALESARSRVGTWKFDGGGWSVLGRGLARVYDAAVEALRTAEPHPTVENLHEWRKQSKYFWSQLQLLRPIHRKEMTRLIDDVHRLTQLLGDDHDLAMLERICDEKLSSRVRDGVLRRLIPLLQRRRSQLQQEAFALGRQVYALSSEELVARLRRWWKSWRSKPVAR